MFSYQYYSPTKVIFGCGCVNEDINENLPTEGKALYVLCGGANSEGVYEAIKTKLLKGAAKVDVFSGIQTNPTTDQIIEATNKAKEFSADILITIGGGSVHDTGKAVSLMMSHEGDLEEYSVTGNKGVPAITNRCIPIITVPTISGTGAEISPASLVRINNKKEIIFSPYLYPLISIIDPSLMSNAPAKLSAQVGIDTFVQALESFTASNANPCSDMFAEASLKNTISYLPRLVEDPQNDEYRSYVALASLQSIYAVSTSGVGGVHALSDPLSGHFNIHHGQALAMLLTKIMKLNLDVREEKFAKLTKMFGTNLNSIKDSAIESIRLVEKYLADIGLVDFPRLNTVISNKDIIDILVEESFNPDMSTNPKILTKDEVKSVFCELL